VSRKRKKNRPRKQTRTCVCTRCGASSERSRYQLIALAAGVRCEACGGNVVEKRFA
jgi:DNA-directed RNA polymerase subunit RPC12/RpoP